MNNKYFVLRQNPVCENAALITNANLLAIKQATLRGDYQNIPNSSSIMQIQSSQNNVYPDILSKQLFLVSDKIMDVIRQFEPSMEFANFYLMDVKNERMNSYILPNIPMIRDGFKIEDEKIRFDIDFQCDLDIFRLYHPRNNFVVVSPVLAESILKEELQNVALSYIE